MFGKWNYPSNYCPINLILMKLRRKKNPNFERNDGCITFLFRFTTKLVWRNYPYCKREQQKVLSF
ncbi:hypothetical protein MTR67_017413 [Solanum verrucosum]|uniref:Uncharacterized protein n=1 Tax=Solanum verrucosum TaxID=315347 RepID=A0AAF0TLT0_SOLVR|nr:hypothetical protein MTR67_017409 [Solanum verrucosum]WMV24028.1 hypothetical protein MTR67_017413 [Solanum verrucosum]